MKPKVAVFRDSLMLTSWWQQAQVTRSKYHVEKEPIVPIKGSCHCGNTQFEVTEAPTDVTRCTCSLCSKRGALVLVPITLPAQLDRLTSSPMVLLRSPSCALSRRAFVIERVEQARNCVRDFDCDRLV